MCSESPEQKDIGEAWIVSERSPYIRALPPTAPYDAHSTYADILGYMDFEDLYTAAVERAEDSAYFIEVGSLVGQSTVFLAQEAARQGKHDLRIDAIDLWPGNHREWFLESLRACGVEEAITPRKAASVDAAQETPNGSADFIMIDADHAYTAIRDDIAAWWPKLKIGGWFACHDYANIPDVRRAFDEAFGLDHYVGKRSALVQKTGPSFDDHIAVALPDRLLDAEYEAERQWHMVRATLAPGSPFLMEMVAFHAASDGLRGVEKLTTLVQHWDRDLADRAREALWMMLDERRPLVDREEGVRLLLQLTSLEYPLQTRWSAMRQLKRLPRELILEADRPAREAAIQPGKVVDGLRRTEITVPEILQCDRCIATVISPGYEGQLDLMLQSLYRAGEVKDATIVVFLVDADESCRRIARKHGAHVFEARSLTRRTSSVKGCLYTLYDCVHANSYVLLEADMIVMRSLEPLFQQLEELDRPVIASVGATAFSPDEVGRNIHRHFNKFFDDGLQCAEEDWHWLTGRDEWDRPQHFSWGNGGLIALNREGMKQLTKSCRDLQPFFHTWMDCAPEHIYWREEFTFNLVAALEGMILELPERYNVQFQSPLVSPRLWRGKAYHQDDPAVILHFATHRGKVLFPIYLRDLAPVLGLSQSITP